MHNETLRLSQISKLPRLIKKCFSQISVIDPFTLDSKVAKNDIRFITPSMDKAVPQFQGHSQLVSYMEFLMSKLISLIPSTTMGKAFNASQLEAMPLQKAQNVLAAAEHKSHWRHGKHGSAEITQRKHELKVLRPAIKRITALIQLTIPGLEE